VILRLLRRARTFLFDVPDMSPAWLRDQRRQHGLEELQPPESRGEWPAPRPAPPARDHRGYREPGVGR
jgi:hypothetical protein